MKRKWLWLSIVIVFLFVDQLTKQWARDTLNFAEEVEVIKGILHWKLLFNTGAAFSSLEGQAWLLIGISLFMSGFLIYYSFKSFKEESLLSIISFAFLTTGALGNLIDRVISQKVTDFIDLLVLPGNFPVFNVADICINIGVFLFLMQFVTKKKTKTTN